VVTIREQATEKAQAERSKRYEQAAAMVKTYPASTSARASSGVASGAHTVCATIAAS
jgi:hypothetical protein